MLKWTLWLPCFAILLAVLRTSADQVIMSNGDTYNGTVLSLNTNTLVLKNENLGKVTLMRNKVASITFGNATPPPVAATAPTNAAIPHLTSALTNSADPTIPALRGIGSQSNLIQQVETQFLAPAGPEAVNKFNDLLAGIDSGQINMNSLRAQAQSAADQLRALKKDMGSDADSDSEIDSYLTILDSFLAETSPTNSVKQP